jgi:hypothetical protein
MDDKTYYILQGGPENLRWWLKNEEYRTWKWFWTANKHIKPGDIAFIYLTSPLSRLVGSVDILGEPFFHFEDTQFDNSHMHNKWCVEVGNPKYFGDVEDKCAECGVFRNTHRLRKAKGLLDCPKFVADGGPLSMTNLRKLFAVDWGWVRYPRGNTRVPDEILPALKELIYDR